MYVETYREYGISPSKVGTLSAAELLGSSKGAHFASFDVDLVGVVSNRGDGKYHIDMQAAGKDDDYYVLCMSSNNAGRFVMESIKRIILMNNEVSGNTVLSVYTSKDPYVSIYHGVAAPVLYANIDVEGNAKLHYKFFENRYFDHILGRPRNSTSLNIYYLSPFYYRDESGRKTQITTNIVLSGMEIGTESAKEELGKMLRNHDAYSGEYRQANLESFTEGHAKF